MRPTDNVCAALLYRRVPCSTNLRVTAVEKAKQGETLLLESRHFLGLTAEADGGRIFSSWGDRWLEFLGSQVERICSSADRISK
jgi:hypothetical protein